MIDFSPLDRVLETATHKGGSVAFWWRDDDAAQPSPALERLLDLSGRHDIPLALAVIPAKAGPELKDLIEKHNQVSVLVHGLHHANHAPQGLKKAEFGDHRSLEAMREEAEHARHLLDGLFPPDVPAPVFVPPWNRIAPSLAAFLPMAGYRALSTFGERQDRYAAPGLLHINTHLDPIAWHDGRSLVDPAVLIRELTGAVLLRLAGRSNEPIGLLTHHLVHDEAVWAFCEALIARLLHSPATSFIDIRGILTEPGICHKDAC